MFAGEKKPVDFSPVIIPLRSLVWDFRRIMKALRAIQFVSSNKTQSRSHVS